MEKKMRFAKLVLALAAASCLGSSANAADKVSTEMKQEAGEAKATAEAEKKD